MYSIHIYIIRGIRTRCDRSSIIKDNGGNRQPFLLKFLPQTSLIKIIKKKRKCVTHTTEEVCIPTYIIVMGKVYTRYEQWQLCKLYIRPIRRRRGLIFKIQVRSTPTVFGVQQTRNNWNIKIYIPYTCIPYTRTPNGRFSRGYHTNHRFYIETHHPIQSYFSFVSYVCETTDPTPTT